MTDTLFSERDASLTPASLWSLLAPSAPSYPCLLRARYCVFRRPRPEVDAIIVDGTDRVDRGRPIAGADALDGWLRDLRACGLHVCHLEATRALAGPRDGATPLSAAAIDDLRESLRARLAEAAWLIPREGGECVLRLRRTNCGASIDVGWAGTRAWSEWLYADIQPAASAWLGRHIAAFTGIHRLGAILTLPAKN